MRTGAWDRAGIPGTRDKQWGHTLASHMGREKLVIRHEKQALCQEARYFLSHLLYSVTLQSSISYVADTCQKRCFSEQDIYP